MYISTGILQIENTPVSAEGSKLRLMEKSPAHLKCTKPNETKTFDFSILLMEEILHHLLSMKPYQK